MVVIHLDNTVRLLTLTYILLAMAIVTVVLILINRHNKKRYSEIFNELEREKNLILNSNIQSELNKVESMINSKDLEEKYDEWKRRFDEIKTNDIPMLTDYLIEVEDLFKNKKYKEIEPLLAKTELNIYNVKTKASFLLEEIKSITLSEERNRETVTKLKSKYRSVLNLYKENINSYSLIRTPIELQFENIDKLFSAFEIAMDKKALSEVAKIVRALDDAINNLEAIMEEAPEIILLGAKIIPKKMADVNNIYSKMVRDGFNLDYLSIKENTDEAEKKIADIFDRLKVLNLEDSMLELKTISDYFDNIYNDYDRERLAKTQFQDNGKNLINKINKMNKIATNLNSKMNEIVSRYEISDTDIKGLNILVVSLKGVMEDYDELVDNARKREKAFSKLNKELVKLNKRVIRLEDNLDGILRMINDYKMDETRAHDQLDEISNILAISKEKINSYKLPVIPKKYYIELAEATEAIKEMVKELEKKPLNIEILNTRVDTARDLTLKLYKTTVDTVKTASMAEHAIVYGNRYRANNPKVASGLDTAEKFFLNGEFKESLECAINTLNIVEPGIHERLLSEFNN